MIRTRPRYEPASLAPKGGIQGAPSAPGEDGILRMLLLGVWFLVDFQERLRRQDVEYASAVEWQDSAGRTRVTSRDEVAALNDIDRQQLKRRLEALAKLLRDRPWEKK